MKQQPVAGVPAGKRLVDSLLDHMQDGAEYGSLLDCLPRQLNVRNEIRRAVAEIEDTRGRPLLVYAANVLKSVEDVPVSIIVSDDLPFAELVNSVSSSAKAVDIFLVTPGGSGQQVSQFVQRLRPRFDDVSFLLPHMCMSAGTIWALPGNEIWMDERAFLGPIDPQVPAKDGQLVPAQTILRLIKRIQDDGDQRIQGGLNPQWSDIQLLRNLDPKEIGNALALSQYSIQLATNYLENHKFRDWKSHKNGTPVTSAEKAERARYVAGRLCSHDIWNVHSHGISRDVAWNELKIKIEHTEAVPKLHRGIRRLWALLYWVFENASTAKIFLSQNYALFRNQPKAAP